MMTYLAIALGWAIGSAIVMSQVKRPSVKKLAKFNIIGCLLWPFLILVDLGMGALIMSNTKDAKSRPAGPKQARTTTPHKKVVDTRTPRERAEYDVYSKRYKALNLPEMPGQNYIWPLHFPFEETVYGDLILETAHDYYRYVGRDFNFDETEVIFQALTSMLKDSRLRATIDDIKTDYVWVYYYDSPETFIKFDAQEVLKRSKAGVIPYDSANRGNMYRHLDASPYWHEVERNAIQFMSKKIDNAHKKADPSINEEFRHKVTELAAQYTKGA